MKYLSSLLLLGMLACGFVAGEPLQPGDVAPDFSMQGSDGKTYTLEQFAGKQAVVIAWFPKTFTGGWTAECKSLRESGKTIRQFDVAYFGANIDPLEQNKKFAESLQLDFPLLADPDKTAAQAYRVLAASGKYTSRNTIYIGADGKILEVDSKVNPKTAGADIAAKLEKYGVAKRKSE